ncbi:hypothetical protein K4L44_04570 [Halosquirtibacter laminarini]|uniref:Uncharacterized protein n=1 Tax=Halosquirtibacter laminarini TaxID=3374600 RepID=A0AC61NHG3_9BACT|nr:hypothetical protein K4L44_04570 [Prolixibacteraceae bacterium]
METALTYKISILLLLVPFFGVAKRNDWNRDNLKGKVVSFTEVAYRLEKQNNRFIKSIKAWQYMEYDTKSIYDFQGNKVEELFFGYDGGVEKRCVYSFNKDNLPTTNLCYDRQGTIRHKTCYDYNEQNCLVSKTCWREDTLFSKSDYRYNTEFQLKEVKVRYYYSQKMNHTMPEWSDKGASVSFYYYDEKATLYERIEYKRKDSLTIEVRYNGNGKIIGRNFCTYDDHGHELDYSSYDYDEQTQEQHLSEYDPYGNIMESYWFTDDGDIMNYHSYSYEYDAYGNWTKQYITNDDQFYYLVEREYSYEE